MKKINRQMAMAKKAGLSNVDLCRMRETARKEAAKMETRATEKALLYMMAIPLNVLVNDYWPKTAKRRAKKFIKDVLSLYRSVEVGVVSDRELADLLWEYAEVTVEAEWLEEKKKEEK